MDKEKVTSKNSSRGNGVDYSDAEIVIKPQFKPRPSGATGTTSSSAVKTTDDRPKSTPAPPKRSLSGKQIAYLLDLDPNKKKDLPKEKPVPQTAIAVSTGRVSPRRAVMQGKAQSVAEMLKAKRLEGPTITGAQKPGGAGQSSSVRESLSAKGISVERREQSEAVSAMSAKTEPVTVVRRARQPSPRARVVPQMSTVINVDEIKADRYGKRLPRSIMKPINHVTKEEDSDSSDDGFLTSFGSNIKGKRSSNEMESTNAIMVDHPSESKNPKASVKPIKIPVSAPIQVDWSEDDTLKRKVKRLKTQDIGDGSVEPSGVSSIPVPGPRLILRKSPEQPMGDATPKVSPNIDLSTGLVVRQGSDSQNELMELGFTKREHGDSQHDSQKTASQPDSQNDSQSAVVDLSKPNVSKDKVFVPRSIEPGRSLLTTTVRRQNSAEDPRIQVETNIHVHEVLPLAQDPKMLKTTQDAKILPQVSGAIDPATLRKGTQPQYIRVIKPNKESLLKGKQPHAPVVTLDGKDSDLKLLDSAIKIVQRNQLQPHHRVISVPSGQAPAGQSPAEKVKTPEAGSEIKPLTVGGPPGAVGAAPPGMVTVSRDGQTAAITIPQPIQIVSSLAEKAPMSPAVLPPGHKIKVMIPSSVATNTARVAGLNSTSLQGSKFSVASTAQAITTTAAAQVTGVGIQKARVINVSSVNQNLGNKLTYAQQFQAVHRALPGIVKVQPVAMVAKPLVLGTTTKAQEQTGAGAVGISTVAQPVYTTTTKPAAPEPVSMAMQKQQQTARLVSVDMKKLLGLEQQTVQQLQQPQTVQQLQQSQTVQQLQQQQAQQLQQLHQQLQQQQTQKVQQLQQQPQTQKVQQQQQPIQKLQQQQQQKMEAQQQQDKLRQQQKLEAQQQQQQLKQQQLLRQQQQQLKQQQKLQQQQQKSVAPPIKIKQEPVSQDPVSLEPADEPDGPLTIDESVKSSKIPSTVIESAPKDHPYGSSSIKRNLGTSGVGGATDWSHLSGKYRVLPKGILHHPPKAEPPSTAPTPTPMGSSGGSTGAGSAGNTAPGTVKRLVKSVHPGLKGNPSETNPYMEMVAEVEQLHLDNPDGNDRKVEQLRRDCRMLFAVVLFSSEVWGHNQKRKGIYKKDLRSAYNWPENVPYCSLNNTKQDIDEEAPRARKEDLVQIFRYLLDRYRHERRYELFTSKEAMDYFREYDPLDLGTPKTRLSNITIVQEGTVKQRELIKKQKQNFSEYLKELTQTGDPGCTPTQLLPVPGEYQSDEELNQLEYSPRCKSRKMFHSAPVSPPQGNMMGGIELLLAASEALSAEQRGEQKRTPRPPFSVKSESPAEVASNQEIFAALQLMDLNRLKEVKTEPTDTPMEMARNMPAVDALLGASVHASLVAPENVQLVAPENAQLVAPGEVQQIGPLVAPADSTVNLALRMLPPTGDMGSDDSQQSSMEFNVSSSQESQSSFQSVEVKPEVLKDFSKRLNLKSPGRSADLPRLKQRPAGTPRQMSDLATIVRAIVGRHSAHVSLRVPETTCPIVMRKGGLSYYATTVLGNSTVLRGPESDVELWIPGDMYCTVIGCVHTNTQQFQEHIEPAECLVGPIPDISVHYRSWHRSSNPLSSFTLKVPHCLRDQHRSTKLNVRRGNVHKLKKFKEELPERSSALIGEAFYEVDRDHITIHTRGFSQFICTACERSWSCELSGTALVFGGVETVGQNSHVHIRPYICSPLFSIQDYKKELKGRLLDLQCPRRLLQDRRIDFPHPLVQINKSEVELDLNIIKDENPENRWMPSAHHYKSKLSSMLGYDRCHSCKSGEVSEVTEFSAICRNQQKDYFEGMLTIKIEGQLPLAERSGLENAASASNSNAPQQGRAVYKTTTIPVNISATKNSQIHDNGYFENGGSGDGNHSNNSSSSQISAKLIARLVQRVFTSEWMLIQAGLHLGLAHHEIETIKTNHPHDIRMAGYSLLNQWLAHTGGGAPSQCNILARVLSEMGLVKTAEDLGLMVRRS